MLTFAISSHRGGGSSLNIANAAQYEPNSWSVVDALNSPLNDNTGYYRNSGSFDINSSVTVTGSAAIAGKYSESSSSDGSITVTDGGDIGSGITLYGGFAKSTTEGTTANSNKVTISGSASVSGVVIGGYAKSGLAANVSANNNEVHLDGSGTYSGDIYGGYAEAGATGTNTVTANNNKIYISSGTYTGKIYTAYQNYGGTGSGASDNTLYVYGTANLSEAILIGAVGSTRTGNTLQFGYNGTAWTPTNYTVGAVQVVNTIKFDTAKWGQTITITDLMALDDVVVDAKNVAFTADNVPAVGDSYNMLKITNFSYNGLRLSNGQTSESSNYTIGTSLQGTGTVSVSDSNSDSKYDTVTYTIAS